MTRLAILPDRQSRPDPLGLLSRALGPVRRIYAGAVLPLLAAGCLSAPIDRADHAAEERIDQATARALQIAQDAAGKVDDVRAAAVADVAARLTAERAATLADVDARMTAQREAAAADVARLLAPMLAEVRASREAATAESAAWREEMRQAREQGVAESAAWRAQVDGIRNDVRTALGQPTGPAGPAPMDPTDKAALWVALGGAVFTAAKTGLRIAKSRKAAKAAGGEG